MRYIQNTFYAAVAVTALGCYGSNCYSGKEEAKQTKPSNITCDGGNKEDISDKIKKNLGQSLWPASGVVTCTEEDIKRSSMRVCKNIDSQSESYQRHGCADLLKLGN